MRSTKSLYIKWLVLYIFSLVLGVLLIVLDYKAPHGYLVVAISLFLDIYYIIRILIVKNIEKKCTICEGRFVGAEKTSLGWRHPKFSITIELNVNGEKVLVKTPSGYTSSDVSGLTKESIIKVGYIKNFEQVITL